MKTLPITTKISGSPLSVAGKQVQNPAATERSPYLNAILSGASNILNIVYKNSTENPDRDAALRYIKQSGNIKKTK